MKSLHALAVACALALTASGASAQETAPSGSPMVLVVEGAAGRLSVLRLRRALASVLVRPIVRLTDAEAEAASHRLTIAFAAPRSWTLVLEGPSRVSRTIEIRGPALETLVGVAVDMVRSLDAPAEPRARTERPTEPAASALAHPWTGAALTLASEILDPFAGMPLSRVAIAAVSDLLDPFAAVGSSIPVARNPEVLDPWR
jgi:hypothetical protein